MADVNLPIHETQLPRRMSANGISIREDVLYTNAKGEADERSKKRADEALSSLREVLPNLLEPNEAVLYVIKSCQAPVGVLEQLLLGWYIYRVTATRLVFTNLRLLHFGLVSDKKWDRTLKSVRWGDILEAKTKGWISRLLKLKYVNGKKEQYWRLRRKDAQKAKVILDAVMPQSRAETTAAQGMQSLCPNCRASLTPGTYQCAACGLKFKDEKTLLRRTLLIPGGGYLYSGFTFLGGVTFLTEGAFTLAMIYYVLMAVGLVPPEASENGRPFQTKTFWGAAIFFAVILGLNKALEYSHSRRVIQKFLPLKAAGEV
jgi:hypothetical protein